MPAGRNASAMPSGVSAVYSVSSDTLIFERRCGAPLRLHDDGVGDVVVQALVRLAKNQQAVDEHVEHADERDDADHAADRVAQPDEPAERRALAVAAYDAQAEQHLADRLPARGEKEALHGGEQHEPADGLHEERGHHRDVAGGHHLPHRRREHQTPRQRADQKAVEEGSDEACAASAQFDAVGADHIGHMRRRRREAIAIRNAAHVIPPRDALRWGRMVAERECAVFPVWRSPTSGERESLCQGFEPGVTASTVFSMTLPVTLTPVLTTAPVTDIAAPAAAPATSTTAQPASRLRPRAEAVTRRRSRGVFIAPIIDALGRRLSPEV